MNQAELSHQQHPASQADDDEFSLLELLIVLAKYKKFIIGLPVAVGAISVAISFAMPDVYKATTKMLPPQAQQSGAAALLSQLGGVASAAAGIANLKNPNDLYVGMLKSRTVADNLIQKFDLKKVYDTDLLEKTRKELEDNTTINASKDGLITIEVEDKDPQRVAQLANSYVSELVQLTKVLALSEAAQRRMFFEKQLELSKNNLATAEMELKRALDTRGVVSVDVDSRAIVETTGRLRAQISAKEIELNSMAAFVTTNNTSYKRVQEELSSLRSELAKLENGRSEPETPLSGKSKQSGLENIKLLRDVKYYQMLYELLAKQYEVARLDEAKDASIVQVLDVATVPERKFKPKRAVIGLLSTVMAFLAALVYVFLVEKKKKLMESAEGAAQWNQLRSHLRLR